MDFESRIETFRSDFDEIVSQIGRVIVGHQRVVEQVVICLLAGGHVLLEGVPGLGKTLLVRTLGDVLNLQFSRIQFTPDLMPADIIGTNVVETDAAGSKSFKFQPGPIFSNLILADEVNRATPKTQSALLEAMSEGTVSVYRTTHVLPKPVFVLATQNPLEMEGTYPLPEAQLDRFFFKILLETPSREELVTIMDRTTGVDNPSADCVLDGGIILSMQALARQVVAASHVSDYIARLVLATHAGEDATENVRRFIRYGASPRGAQAILLGAKVRAISQGRANVSFEDVHAVALPALRHRLGLSFEGQGESVSADDILADLLEKVPQKQS